MNQIGSWYVVDKLLNIWSDTFSIINFIFRWISQYLD